MLTIKKVLCSYGSQLEKFDFHFLNHIMCERINTYKTTHSFRGKLKCPISGLVTTKSAGLLAHDCQMWTLQKHINCHKAWYIT